MMFLFNSQTDYYHISTGFAFSDCYMRSSQIGCQCQKSHFDILLVDSKMTTSSGISAAYCDIHHVFEMAFFHRMVSIHLPKSVNSILFNHQALVHIFDT
jgi:hypothetical protein